MIITILLLSLNLLSEPCARINISTPCYGECGNFIDQNNNGICDTWEKYNLINKDKKIVEGKSKLSIYQNINQNTNITRPNLTTKLTNYGFIHIFFITTIIIILTEIFIKNSCGLRLFWNWILLLSALLSSLSGFILYFSIFNNHKGFIYSLHIQSSLIFFISAFYHTIKRFKCMLR